MGVHNGEVAGAMISCGSCTRNSIAELTPATAGSSMLYVSQGKGLHRHEYRNSSTVWQGEYLVCATPLHSPDKALFRCPGFYSCNDHKAWLDGADSQTHTSAHYYLRTSIRG